MNLIQNGKNRYEFTSQTWQDYEWRHTITADLVESDLTLLTVTGGDENFCDFFEQKRLAELSGVNVATLYQIPNQPMWDLVEDELIAHTFVYYLETGDPSWPLLVPMVRSVVAAMDAIEEVSQGRCNRFLVTGASKRGWIQGSSASRRSCLIT
jgi:PhoPQ-activated pathogenicity-related protein